MKKLAFALGVLVLGLSAAGPASADDYAVVKWGSGYCRVWTDTQYGPQDGKYLWFRHHRHHHHHWRWHYRFHTWDGADRAMHRAVGHHRCDHWW